MTIEQKRRELFEAYCISDAGGYCKEQLERDAEGNYTIVWEYWELWNAALDAVVIELPPSMGMPDEDDCDGYEEYEAMEAITCAANGMRGACKKAIESAGLGLKVNP